MKNTTKPKKTSKKQVRGYASEKTRWAYWMQAIEPTSEELNREFPDYHPQWLQRSQRMTVSPESFKMMRESLGLSISKCAAYMRLGRRIIYYWEDGTVPVPFIAFELLRMIRESVWFKMAHPDWDGWFISEKGVLVSPNIGNSQFTPEQLDMIAWQGTEAGRLRGEMNRLQAKLNAAIEENTSLREMFLDNGVTDEVAAMQDKINALMKRINTARVIPLAPANIEQVELLEEKAA